MGHFVRKLDDRSICDWTALWSAYTIGWVRSRAQFAATAKERGLDPGRLERYLGPMAHRHYLATKHYDKFDIWKMMADNQVEQARPEWFADLPRLYVGMGIKALCGIE